MGIDTTETAPIVKAFLSPKGVLYPVALGSAAGYDADGIVRARWIGPVTAAQLAHYARDAGARRATLYLSSVQMRIDTLLSPHRFRFEGSESERAGAIAGAQKAVLRAEDLVAKNEAHADYERTSREEGVLLYAAGKAEREHAATAQRKFDGLTLMARGAGGINDWEAAVRAYREALRLSPDDPKLVRALSRAYYRLHDYDAMIDQARRYSQLKPTDGDGWAELGLAFGRARRFEEAAPAYEKALSLLATDARAKPSKTRSRMLPTRRWTRRTCTSRWATSRVRGESLRSQTCTASGSHRAALRRTQTQRRGAHPGGHGRRSARGS